MQQKELRNVRICGIQCAIPQNIISNGFFLSDFTEEEINKAVALTGVRERRFSDSSTCTSDLCIASARKLMKDLDWNPATVDALIYVTQTPDFRIPATSCVIQEALGITTECAAFDVNLGCSGYVYGLWMVGNFVANGCVKRALLLVGDTPSKMISPQDRSTALLFGDAGTATAMEFDDKAPAMSFVLGTDGKGKENLIIPAGGYRNPSTPETTLRTPLPGGGSRSQENVYMEGGEIFNFTITRVPPLVKALLVQSNIESTDIDYAIFHQANKFIMKHLAKKLKLTEGQAPMSIEKYGNTSSASIPLTIADKLQGELLGKSRTVALVGFGVGYSWGAALVKLGPLDSLGILEA